MLGSQEGKPAAVEYEKPDDNSESMAEGSVSLKTYWGYLKCSKSFLLLFLVSFNFIATQLLLSSNELWLSFW
jgi:hypothetical protein